MKSARSQKPAGPAPVGLTARPWFFPALLLAAAFAAYANSFSLGLAMDATLLMQDPRIQAATADNLRQIFTGGYWWNNPWAALYRPVTTLSFLLVGDGASANHFFNFLLHAGNVLLVFSVASLLLEAAGAAFVAALIWAVHPAGVEAVTNVAGRADLLAAMAVLSGLLWYARRSRAGADARVTAAGLFAIATVGVFSKENAVILPAAMLLWDLCSGAFVERVRRGWMAYAAAAVSVALWAVSRMSLRAMEIPFGDNPMAGAGFVTARLTAIKVIGKYLWILICPLTLSADYSFNEIPLASWSDVGALASLLAVVVLLAAAVLRFGKDKAMFFAAGFFALALLPVSNLAVVIGTIMAERLIYLPAVGFCLAVAALLWRMAGARNALVAVAVLAAVLGARTMARNRDWTNDDVLWAANAITAPGSYKAHATPAQKLAAQNLDANIDRAILELEKSWAIIQHLPAKDLPETPVADLAESYRLKGEAAGGMGSATGRAWYEKSLAMFLRAREADVLIDRAVAEVERKSSGQVLKVFGFADLYRNLGHLYLNMGRLPEAVEALRYGRRIEPHNPTFYTAIAAVQSQQGDAEGARMTLLEQVAIGAGAPETIGHLRGLYTQVAGGQCAITESGAGPQLNPSCPKVADDLCKASASVVRVLEEARQIPEAQRRKAEGCK